MNSQQFSELAQSERRTLRDVLTRLITEGRMSISEANEITSTMEKVVYAERMNIHKTYDESFEALRS